MQVARGAKFGHFGRTLGITGRITRRAARMRTWEGENAATCISQQARAELRASGLASSKASPSSPTPTASTLEAQRPATLARYPSSAAVAKPFGCRGSLAACTTDNVHADSVLVESSACHVALDLTRAALQPELSRRTSVIASSSSTLNRLHLTTV